jgi:hypothetical protein
MKNNKPQFSKIRLFLPLMLLSACLLVFCWACILGFEVFPVHFFPLCSLLSGLDVDVVLCLSNGDWLYLYLYPCQFSIEEKRKEKRERSTMGTNLYHPFF